MNEITILVDTREQKPLRFPDFIIPYTLETALSGRAPTVRVRTEAHALPTGDYTLQGYEHLVLVERKSSLLEISANILSKDRRRFFDCLSRLADSCVHPILFIQSISFPLYSDPHIAPDEQRDGSRLLADFRAFDVLVGQCARLGIQMMWGTWRPSGPAARTLLGEILLRYMYQAVQQLQEKGDSR